MSTKKIKTSEKLRNRVWDYVKPEVKEVVCRGSISYADICYLQGDSYDWVAIATALDDDSLVQATEYVMAQVVPNQVPPTTYNEALRTVYTPLLLERFKEMQAKLQKSEDDYSRLLDRTWGDSDF